MKWDLRLSCYINKLVRACHKGLKVQASILALLLAGLKSKESPAHQTV